MNKRRPASANGHCIGKRPRGIAFLADGNRAYVRCELAGKVFAIDVASQRVIAEIAAGSTPNGAWRRIPMAAGSSFPATRQHVMAIDTASNAVVATVQVGEAAMEHGPDAGRRRRLYVANGRSNGVSVIDTGSYKAGRYRSRRTPQGEHPMA